jgi:hypothetical protein
VIDLSMLLLHHLYHTLQAEQDPRARGLELLREGRAREAVTCLEWSRTKLKAANSPLYPACLLDLALACMKVCVCVHKDSIDASSYMKFAMCAYVYIYATTDLVLAYMK